MKSEVHVIILEKNGEKWTLLNSVLAMLMVSKDWFYNFEAKMGKMLQIVIMNSR
jgi:hypothetical protein